MAAAHYHCPGSLILRSNTRLRLGQILTLKSSENSWLGTELRVGAGSLSVRPHVSIRKRRHLAVTASLSLPTAKPERSSPGQEIPKWSSKAIKSFAMAELEAIKIFSPTTNSEALIVGILIVGTSLAATFLRAHGITLFKVRHEIAKSFEEDDPDFIGTMYPPLTDEAQRVLDWAVDHKMKSVDGGEITTGHILLGIWSEVDCPGHKILSTLGFCDEMAKELESLISKPGCTDE